MGTNLYIVTGVNGIGKSTVIPHIVSKLDSEKFVVYDFDERGVPDNANSDWRKLETTHWLQQAHQNAVAGKTTIVCGFMKASDIEYARVLVPDVPVEVCLLDATPEVISQRILSRYTTPESLKELERTTGKTPEKFVSDNMWVATKFREAAQENGFHCVATGNKTPHEVSEELVAWVLGV